MAISYAQLHFLPNLLSSSIWNQVSFDPVKVSAKPFSHQQTNLFCIGYSSQFSLNQPHWADSLIESPCPPVWVCTIALWEKTLKKWHLEFASPSGDYSTFLCLTLSFLIINPLILQNTFWSYKILVSFSTTFF